MITLDSKDVDFTLSKEIYGQTRRLSNLEMKHVGKLAIIGALERFSFECGKLIGFCVCVWFSRYVIGLKDSRHFFIQSEVKPKPIVSLLATLCVSYM